MKTIRYWIAEFLWCFPLAIALIGVSIIGCVAAIRNAVEDSKMRKLKGTFTNREIIVWVVLVFIFAAVTEFHWIGFATGALMSTFFCWTTRKAINAEYHLRRFWVKNDGK